MRSSEGQTPDRAGNCLDTRRRIEGLLSALGRLSFKPTSTRHPSQRPMRNHVTRDAEQLRAFAKRYTAAWYSMDPARVAGQYAPERSLTINDGPPAVGRAAITEAARGFHGHVPPGQPSVGVIETHRHAEDFLPARPDLLALCIPTLKRTVPIAGYGLRRVLRAPAGRVTGWRPVPALGTLGPVSFGVTRCPTRGADLRAPRLSRRRCASLD